MGNAFGIRYKAGSCVVCGFGTDTAVAVLGDLDWQTAIVTLLGVPEEQAFIMVERDSADDGKPLYVQVCGSCVAKSTFGKKGLKPALMIAGHAVPCLRQPLDAREMKS